MQEREILEVEQGTSSSENIDGVYTLSITGEDLEAAVEQVEENKTIIQALQTSIGTINADIDGVETSISGINNTIDTMTDQMNDLNSIVGNEGSLTKTVTNLQSRIGTIDGRLAIVEASVSEENEFEGRVSDLETRLNGVQLTSIQNSISMENAFMHLEDKILPLEGVIYDSKNEEGGTNNGLISRVVDLEGNFKSDGYVTKGFSTLTSSIESLQQTTNDIFGVTDQLSESITSLETQVSTLPTKGYVDGEIGKISSNIGTLNSKITTLEGKTTFKFTKTLFSIPAQRESVINNLSGIENIVGFELTYAVNQGTPTGHDVHMLYIPYESINYFNTPQTLPGISITLKIEPTWTMIDELNNKHELYLTPVFTFNNNNSISIQVAIRTFYSQTNDRIPGSYVD